MEKARAQKLIPEGMDEQYQSNITRLEFARLCTQILSLYLNKNADALLQNAPGEPGNFSDCSDIAVKVASAYGITSGTGGGLFQPNAPITREQAATMILRLVDYLDYNRGSSDALFSDWNSCSDWAKQAILCISLLEGEGGKKVMGGTGNNCFSPKSYYTREQSFCSFARLFYLLKNNKPVGN